MASIDLMTSDELANKLDKLLAEHNCPGASVAIRHGDEVVTAAAGVLNLDTGVEATTDSVFQIGSNTKVYNATLVMQLVDEGKVDLDATVETYLPEFRLKDGAGAGQITVRHLLTHTSGIDGGDYIADFGRGDDAVARFVASLADVGLIHPVGAYWTYCNAGTVVAGRIIEVITGLPWHEALKARLLDPLGMDGTVTLPEDALLRRASAGHMPTSPDDKTPRVHPRWMLPFACGPAGSIMCTTAADLTAFGHVHINGGVGPNGTRVLSEASINAMQDPQFPDAFRVGPGAMGLGWITTEQMGVRILAHGGGTLGQVSQFMTFPDHGVSFASLTNAMGGALASQAIVTDLLGRLGGPEVVAQIEAAQKAGADSAAALPPTADDVDLDNYVGVYERKDVTTTISVVDGGLQAAVEFGGYLAQEQDTPKPTRLHMVNATTCMALDDEGKPVGPGAFAELDDDGRPTYYILGRLARRRP